MIQEGVNGALFDSGNLKDLKEKIRYLWDAPGLCARWAENCGDIPYDTVGTVSYTHLDVYKRQDHYLCRYHRSDHEEDGTA